MIRALNTSVFLAFSEQRADLKSAFCYILAFAAMLTPLMVLLGLKNGMIDRMTEQLLSHPSTLEIIPVGAGKYDRAFFSEVGGLPETGFLVPRTRTISARLLGLRNPLNRKILRGPALVPSGQGDVVTAYPAELGRHEIILSAEAARQLDADVGARVEGWIERRKDGQRERAEITLTVMGVAPAGNHGRVSLFAPVDLLIAVENFLDGHGEAGARWYETALAEPRETFASFRLYAASIHDVLALRDALEAREARVRTRSDIIETVLHTDRALGILFTIIAVVGGGGFWLSMVANLRGNVERLRPTLSMFRLLGADRATRFLFPMAQAALIVAGGVLVTVLAYLLVAAFVEYQAAVLVGEGSVMRLGPGIVLLTGAILFGGALLAAAFASLDSVRVPAHDVFRRV
ncbi:MAG: hypothetical protein AAGF44_05300 [Pseudomonadota bacterium]